MTPRPATLNPQPSIEVHIEELVLHGLPLSRGHGGEVQSAVETELARLLAERGLNGISASATPHVSAGSIRLTNGNQPAPLGQQIAQAVYDGLAPRPALPLPSRFIEGVTK